MLQIPIQAVPSQQLQVVLAGQNVQIAIYEKQAQGLFVDINVNGVDIITAVIAEDANPLNSRTYEPFAGNLVFLDTQGNNDPDWIGLGSRYQLVYLTAAEYDEL